MKKDEIWSVDISSSCHTKNTGIRQKSQWRSSKKDILHVTYYSINVELHTVHLTFG